MAESGLTEQLYVYAAALLIAAALDLALLHWWRRRKPRACSSVTEPRQSKLLAAIALVGAPSFAVLPARLIVRDRWLDDESVRQLFRTTWCASGGVAMQRFYFLCDLALPPYTLLILACLLGLIALFFLTAGDLPLASNKAITLSSGATQRRAGRLIGGGGLTACLVIAGRAFLLTELPGWELALALLAYGLGWLIRAAPFDAIRRAWQARDVLAAMALAHAALVAFLACYYATPPMAWGGAFIMLALAVANLLRFYRRVPPIYWIVSLALVLYTANINSWWFSVIGDEYSFYHYAREIAEKHSAEFIGSHLFRGLAVYGAHPYFSSLLQAISMKLLGLNNFGWRFSSLYLSAMAIGFFYLFFETFLARRAALLAAFLLAISHYIMAFGKIGYNNLQALWAMSLALAAAAWATRTRHPTAFAFAGLACGLCFYVYPAALYVLPLAGLLLLWYAPPLSRQMAHCWATAGVSALALIFPLFLQPDYWQAKVAGTIYYNPTLVQSWQSIAHHLASNLLYAFFSFAYVPAESHFVTASYLDPLSVALALPGMALLFRWAGRKRFALFWVMGLAALLFFVGASHDRTHPPNTRMFLLLPWWTLAAAVGLNWLWEQLARVGVPAVVAATLVGCLLAGAAALNVYQAYALSLERVTSPQTLENLYLRLAGRVGQTRTFVFVTDSQWGIDGLRLLQEVYSIPPSPAQLAQVTLTAPEFATADEALVDDQNSLVIIVPWLRQDWQQAIEPLLARMGKSPCPITATNGDWRFNVWSFGDSPELCDNRP